MPVFMPCPAAGLCTCAASPHTNTPPARNRSATRRATRNRDDHTGFGGKLADATLAQDRVEEGPARRGGGGVCGVPGLARSVAVRAGAERRVRAIVVDETVTETMACIILIK